MNRLPGKIASIQVQGNLSLVQVQVEEVLFSAIVIGTPEDVDFLHNGHDVFVGFKETEVIICTEPEYKISLRNRIPCRIASIDQGVLLSKLSLVHPAGTIESIITSNAVNHLVLKAGMDVYAMIKTNEIMLSP